MDAERSDKMLKRYKFLYNFKKMQTGKKSSGGESANTGFLGKTANKMMCVSVCVFVL